MGTPKTKMFIDIKGSIEESFVLAAIDDISKIFKIPPTIHLFFIDSPKFCEEIAKHVSKGRRREFMDLCSIEKTSLSVTYGGKDVIVILINKAQSYLGKNRKAFIGTMLHELVHVYQRRQGLGEGITADSVRAFAKFQKKLEKLPYEKKELVDMYAEIGRIANFVLNDMYDNIEIIDAGLGEYPLEDYFNLYGSRERCPRPMFYKDLKKPVDLKTLQAAISFELRLLSVVVPFMTRNHEWDARARALVDHIAKCYETNIWEISKAFDSVVKHCIEVPEWNPSFRRKYFTLIFEKVYGLLE